jgi:hypothetical protein
MGFAVGIFLGGFIEKKLAAVRFHSIGSLHFAKS